MGQVWGGNHRPNKWQEVYLHKLFIGHPGCGKTTELYQLLQRVKKADFFTCMDRCDLELDENLVEDIFRCISNAAIRAQLREHYKSFTGLRRVGI